MVGLVERGWGAVREVSEVGVYEGLTGVAPEAGMGALWSVLGGVDVGGLPIDSEATAGARCASMAEQAEALGVGEPFDELDGSAEGDVRLVWWDRGWVPLFMSADDAFAVDGHPGAGGRAGQVIYCDLDYGCGREALWPSLVDFLNDMLAVVSSDGFVVEGDSGIGWLADDAGQDQWMLRILLDVGFARRDGRPVPYPALR